MHSQPDEHLVYDEMGRRERSIRRTVSRDGTHQLSAYMPVDHARNHDRRQSDTVRDLAQRRARVSERGRHGVAARVGVDDDTDDQVEGRVGDLQGVQRLCEVLSMGRSLRWGDRRPVRLAVPTCGSFISAMNVKNPTCPGVEVSYRT